MKSSIENCISLREFTIRCLLDGHGANAGHRVERYWQEAGSVDEFCEKVFGDSDIMASQGGAELSKERPGHKARCLKMLERAGAKVFTTYADAGSVKLVAEGGAWVHISNGYGDGLTAVAIVPKNEKGFNNNMLEFVTAVHGPLGISSHDGDGGDIVAKLGNARYGVYTTPRLVVFKEWD